VHIEEAGPKLCSLKGSEAQTTCPFTRAQWPNINYPAHWLPREGNMFHLEATDKGHSDKAFQVPLAMTPNTGINSSSWSTHQENKGVRAWGQKS